MQKKKTDWKAEKSQLIRACDHTRNWLALRERLRSHEITWSSRSEADSFSEVTAGELQMRPCCQNVAPHPPPSWYFYRSQQAVCQESLWGVQQADSRAQEVRGGINTSERTWNESALQPPLTTQGCKIKATLRGAPNMKLQRCTFGGSICCIFNHPGDWNLLFGNGCTLNIYSQ